MVCTFHNFLLFQLWHVILFRNGSKMQWFDGVRSISYRTTHSTTVSECAKQCGPYSLCLGSLEINSTFTCSCLPGYLSTAMGYTNCSQNVINCNDFNGGCSQVCNFNISTSVTTCACYNSSFSLDVNLRTCNAVNTCETNNGGCEQICNFSIDIFNQGNQTCSCNEGYALNLDRQTCTAINNCDYASGGCWGFSICIDLGPGNSTCECYSGYDSPYNNGTQCKLSNPCLINNGGCTGNSTCNNTAPMYSNCTCLPGYESNSNIGINCTLIPSL